MYLKMHQEQAISADVLIAAKRPEGGCEGWHDWSWETFVSATAVTPVNADFATFSDVHLGSLPIVLVLTGKLNVLELVKHFGYTSGWLGQHRLDWYAHHKCHMLLQLLQPVRKGGIQGGLRGSGREEGGGRGLQSERGLTGVGEER